MKRIENIGLDNAGSELVSPRFGKLLVISARTVGLSAAIGTALFGVDRLFLWLTSQFF